MSLGLSSPTFWVYALMHYVLEIHCLGISMCGWCFNINVTATTTTFCHAWYIKHLLFCCSNTLNRMFLSFTHVAIILSSFLPAGSDLNAIVHNCVYILHVNSLSLMQHAPLHITHQHHLSIQQGHSAHTWMHAGINCVGSKYFRLVSARFVCYQPFSHIPSNLWMYFMLL